MMMIRSDDDVLSELKRAIDDRGGTRTDFAKSCGIGPVYLSEILGGKKPLSRLPLATAKEISRQSGISLDRLAGETEAKRSRSLRTGRSRQ